MMDFQHQLSEEFLIIDFSMATDSAFELKTRPIHSLTTIHLVHCLLYWLHILHANEVAMDVHELDTKIIEGRHIL